MPALAKGDYSFSAGLGRLGVDSVTSFGFDQSDEGKWRARARTGRSSRAALYERIVARAMQAIRRAAR